MLAKRASITLDEASHDMLSRTGNGSAYLSELIKQRWREWQASVALLRDAGWEPADIGIACTRLNGVHDVPRATRLEQFRRSIGSGVELSAADADALAVVAAEWWTGNREMRDQFTTGAESKPAKRGRRPKQALK